MSRLRVLWLGLAILAAALAAVTLGRRDRSAVRPLGPPRSGRSPAAPPARTTSRISETSEEIEAQFTLLERDLGAAAADVDRPRLLRAARALRTFLLGSDSRLAPVLRALCDSGRDRRLREALLVVVGSLPGTRGKGMILGALEEGALAGLERAAILSVGILELEDERVFERDGLPYAVEVASGLVVYIRGEIVDPPLRSGVIRQLEGAAHPQARRAAALVLRDSIAQPDVRGAMKARFSVEEDSEATAEMGASLAGWARRNAPTDPERGLVVGELLDKLPGGDELLRFRLLSPLTGISLRPDEAARMRRLVEASDPDIRKFAADFLGRQLASRALGDPQAVPSLTGLLAGDASIPVRSAAALALANAVGDPRAVTALIQSLSSDSDWEVRAAGARALARHGTPEAAEALRLAASSDPRGEVRAAATRAVAGRSK